MSTAGTAFRPESIGCIEYLGGQCVLFGSTDNLQIDHIDPAIKIFTVTPAQGSP